MTARFDLIAFIAGMIMVAVAGSALWWAFGGPVPAGLLKIAVPAFLVLVGVLGLTLARPRS